MELYILLAIIWGVGVIWSAIYRIVVTLAISHNAAFGVNVKMQFGPEQSLKSALYDFFWFIYLPWVGLKLLFKAV